MIKKLTKKYIEKKGKGVKSGTHRTYIINTKDDSNGKMEEQKRHKTLKTNSKIAEVNPAVGSTTLNVDGLNIPVKWQTE